MTGRSRPAHPRPGAARARWCPGPAVLLPAVAVTVMLTAGCGASATSAPTRPVTVTSVSPSDAAAVTLSTGQRVYDTGLATGITLTAPLVGTCERRFNDSLARKVVAGSAVTASTRINSWASAPAGYQPAKLTYAAMEGMDTASMFSHPQVASARESSCATAAAPPTTTTTTTSEKPVPTTTSEVPSDTNVDVDVDTDDGSSRYCRRHWFC